MARERRLLDERSEAGLAIAKLHLSQLGAPDEARQEAMQAINPVYIPRNHQIEAAIRAAEDQGDFSVFHELHAVLQNPCVQQDGKERYLQAPEPEEVVEYTFCGT